MTKFFGPQETLSPLGNVPDSSHTFQMPAYARVGDDLYVSYYIEPNDPAWSAHFSLDPSGTIDRHAHAVVHFRSVAYFLSELYDDDTIEGHRYADQGLRPFSQFRVTNSHLVNEMKARQAKSNIRQHKLPKELNHFVFAMHGQILEIVAAGFDLHISTGSLASSLEKIVATPQAIHSLEVQFDGHGAPAGE